MDLRLQPLIDRLEYKLVFAALVVAAGLWGFFAILEEVTEGEAHALDERICSPSALRETRRTPSDPWWLDVAMGDITSLGSMTVLGLITAIVVGFLL